MSENIVVGTLESVNGAHGSVSVYIIVTGYDSCIVARDWYISLNFDLAVSAVSFYLIPVLA